MEGRLITDGNNNYSLLDYNNELVATTMESGLTSGKLSIKNCETIVNGYDLDDLAKNTFPSLENCGVYLWMSETDRNRQRSAFIKGFQKALELLVDSGTSSKKFSEDQVRKALSMSRDKSRGEFIHSFKTILDTIQSQQTEWDVEIVMECCGKVYSQHCDGKCENVKPLLDGDGCLILKRI